MSRYFETIRIENGLVYNLAYHQRRFERTSGRTQKLSECITPPKGEGVYRVKVIYSKEQGVEEVLYFPYKKRSIRSICLIEADIEYARKYLKRASLDALYAKRGECDEVLIVRDGLVTDTTIANVAFFDGSEWLTPKKPLLEGTTRARYLDKGQLRTADIAVGDLAEFTKIALLNAMVDFDIMSIENYQKDRLVVK